MKGQATISGWWGWLLLGITGSVSAQQVGLKGPNAYQLEAGAYRSTSTKTPFWQRSNQYGIVPLNAPSLTFRGSLRADYDSARVSKRKFDYGYGLNVVANRASRVQDENAFLLPEAYVKVRYGAFEAYVGRRRELFGLADSTLSSGSYSWSGNALPIPKIQLAIPQFALIGFTKGWVSVMGNFAHGWMNASGFVRHSYLHQSSLYIRLGRAESTLRLFAGFNHQAVWGGVSPDLVKTGLTKTERLPASLSDYFHIVTGDRGATGDTTQYTDFDLTNRIGNHLGTIDLGAEIDLAAYTLFLYRQSIYEDGSLFYLLNIVDGLHGLRIRRNDPDALVHDIVLEFLNTTSQGGNQFVYDDATKRGRDNYFNHAQFRDGWSYQHKTIGTPFITPAIYPNGTYPYGNFTNNNRVHAVHLGLSGRLLNRSMALLSGPVTYQSKFSVSRNFGSYLEPYRQPIYQFSGWVSAVAPLRLASGLALTTSLGYDAGDLYPTSLGFYVGLRKSWVTPRP